LILFFIQFFSKASTAVVDIELVFVLFIRFFLIISIGILVVMTAEIFTTKYRAYAFGCIFFFGTMCGAVSTYSNKYFPVDGRISPALVSFVSHVLIILVIWFFPETVGKNISN
jgi:bacteriorhodopsin